MATKKNYRKTREIPPKPYLIETLSHVGYSLASALSDIIDNSIYAGAKKISIFVDPDPSNRNIQILDDGSGMDAAKLEEAMAFAGVDPHSERDPKDLGRFGLGLKSASFSQCRQLTVATKQNGETNVAEWDRDYLSETGKFLLGEPDLTSIPGIDSLGENGTLVVWRKLAKPVETNTDEFNRALVEASDELGLTFHRFISGEPGTGKVSIYFNKKIIEPFDPFNSSHKAVQLDPEETIKMEKGDVVIQAFTLPHYSKLTEKEWEENAGPEGYLKNQGFYVYREKRLISKGNWLGLAKQTELRKLCRVRVDIPNSLDFEWGIDLKKSGAAIPLKLRDRLRNLVDRMGSPSERIFTERGQRLFDSNPIPVWTRVQSHGEIHYRIVPDNLFIKDFIDRLPTGSETQFKHILELISTTLPSTAIFSDMGGNPDAVTSLSMDKEALENITSLTYKRLIDSGVAAEVVVSMMKGASPFMSNWEFVERIINSVDMEHTHE